MNKRYVLTGCAGLVFLSLILIFSFSGENVATGAAVSSANRENIEIKGSDTLVQMVSNLAEEYASRESGSRISVTGGGSGTGVAALLNGEITLADSSRKINEEELLTAEENEIEIHEVIIARDMLSVIVHQNNPIGELTMDEVGKIFRGEITNWKELGGEDNKITLYGRQSSSGTYAFFQEDVVKGEYHASMRNLEGNQAITEAVKQDEGGVGYVGIGYIVDAEGNAAEEVKVISISNGGEYITPLKRENLAIYPMSRPLYQYAAGDVGRDSVVYEFLMFELSAEGQGIVENSGFVKITEEDRENNKRVLS